MRQLTITRRTIVGRALTLAAGACALTTLLVACGKAPGNTPEVFVVLPSATANEPAPQLATLDLGLLTNAAKGSNNASAYIVNPTTGSATTVSLTPLRADGQVEYGPNRAALISQNVSQVQRLVSAQAASGPFDLLTMMANAIRVTTGPGTLLIVSSGLSTAGGFDLRLVGWDADPATIAAELEAPGGAARPHRMDCRLLRPRRHLTAASPRCRSPSAPRSPSTGWRSATPPARRSAAPTISPARTRRRTAPRRCRWSRFPP